MSTMIYHQAGHFFNWNFESYKDDSAGDGVILGPRYMSKDKVLSIPNKEKTHHIFDPQFFVPSTAKGKLVSYDFFPANVAGEFETKEFTITDALEAAEKCVDFQIENNFKFVVIPSRYIDGIPDNFIEQQQSIYVEPFLNAIGKYDNKPPVLLQVIINSDMIKNTIIFNDLLNWVTGLKGVDGIYLIMRDVRTFKQIKDIDVLYNYLLLIDVLRNNSMLVVLGYLNTESTVLCLADPTIVTMGSYEAQRCFDPAKFMESESSGPRQPNARIYVPSLFQWIEKVYLDSLKSELPHIYEMIPDNQYRVAMFESEFNWHFTNPVLYKHYFVEFFNQMQDLVALSPKDRYNKISDGYKKALAIFREIEASGIILDPNSDGSHLTYWLTAINRFAKHKGWRH